MLRQTLISEEEKERERERETGFRQRW